MSNSSNSDSTRTRLGVEVLLDEQIDLIRGRRVALVCNQASVLPDFRHVADVFAEQDKFELTTLFGPQHGIRGDVQDNMIETAHAVDSRTGIPIYSLYSETREPTEKMLENVDTIVFDMQDVGCRIYTFAYTMANCMRAAKKFGKRVVVCDRPNPITGVGVEGNVTEKEFEIPTRHGMTLGELARLFNEHFGIGCELEIAKMNGWRRGMWFEETRLPWILPSPNIPTVDTCVVFPATVYIEGTELSEGRGTTKVFEINDTPFIDPYKWAAALREFDFPGVAFRECYFHFSFQKWAKQTCGGVQIHVTDRNSFTPVIVGVAMIKTAYDMYSDKFEWKRDAYEYEFGKNPFDVVSGTDKLRTAIEAGEPLRNIENAWTGRLDEFKQIRESFLLY